MALAHAAGLALPDGTVPHPGTWVSHAKLYSNISANLSYPSPLTFSAVSIPSANMQRILQRAERNRRVLRQKVKKKAEAKELQKSHERREHWLRMNATFRQHITDARRKRQVDWDTGALSPRRDVGELAERYATMSMYEMQAPEVGESRRLKWWHLAEGDRVVVVRGRDEGRIGKVQRVDKDRNTVQVADMNVHDFYLPDWARREEGGQQQPSIAPLNMGIPVDDVRLVYPMPDPVTGVPRDVVIERLVQVERLTDDETDVERGDRMIPGTKTIIPWPLSLEPEHEDHEDDTLRIGVDEQTFRPPLLHHPFPPSVIDELRSKYSKTRKRHDWDFVQRKSLEDVSEEKKAELRKTMRTPLQELAELRARQKKASEKELSAEQLAKIGEVIAQQRAAKAEEVARTVEQ